jgi:integrase
MSELGMMANVEQFSEQDWLNDLYSSSESQRTIVIAKISLKTFDQFCNSQKLTRMEMIEKYQKWFKPDRIDGERPDPDIQSICISLGKFVQFMNQEHEDIIIYPKNSIIFKRKSPKTIKLYFSFIKSYLRKCHKIKLNTEDISDYIKFPKTLKDPRKPITLEQLKHIMTHASPERRALYYVLLSSGMRIGEALTLTPRSFDFTSSPVRVTIKAEHTKTREGRDTFVSSEAVEKLRQLLGDFHKKDCICSKCDDVIFGWGQKEAGVNVAYEDQYFIQLRNRLGIMLKHRKADAKSNGSGFFEKYPNSVRYVINIHSMRAYFMSKASVLHGETWKCDNWPRFLS